MRPTRKKSGFTLIELLIVICVISILAALCFSYLLEARRQANEGSAVGTMKAMISGEQVYRNRFGTYADMPSLFSQSLVDSYVAGSGRSGYTFAIGLVNSGQYYATASPMSVNTGLRYFYTDEAGTLFQSQTVTSAPTADTDGIPPAGFSQIGN